MAHRAIVYAICNHATGAAYIGVTGNLKHRWYEQRRRLHSGKHGNPALQAAWARDGERSFGLFVLERVPAGSKYPGTQWYRRQQERWLARARGAGVALYNDQGGRRMAA